MQEENRKDVNLHTGESISVALVITREPELISLVSVGREIANAHSAQLHVFCLTEATDSIPDWFSIPAQFSHDNIVTHTISGQTRFKKLIGKLTALNPIVLGVAYDSQQDDRYLGGREMEHVLRRVNCHVLLLKGNEGWSLPESHSAFVPFWDDENTRFAIRTAYEMNPELKITAVRVVAPSAEENERLGQVEEFQNLTKEWAENDNFSTKLIYSFDEQQALLQEAEKYDFLLTGVGMGSRVIRTILGDFRNKLVHRLPGPAIILRENQGKAGAILFKGWSVIEGLIPTLSREDRIGAYRMIRRGGRPSRDFYTMTVLSASIASMGLILDSAAVIIGAMLVAPLMSAIIGMGMATIHGDLRFLLTTSRAALIGAASAILTGFVFGLINFHGETTNQILQRTNPSILDLAVAIISGVAAAYALCRNNVSNSLPGVAIAVALVPPLATVGVCLSIGYWGLAWGALKLYLSNMVGIVFASAMVFNLFGFRPNVDALDPERRIMVFRRSITASGVLVLVILCLLVTQTAKELQKERFDDDVHNELVTLFEEHDIEAELEYWSIITTKDGVFRINAHVKSPEPISGKKIALLEEELGRSLHKDVELELEIVEADALTTEENKD